LRPYRTGADFTLIIAVASGQPTPAWRRTRLITAITLRGRRRLEHEYSLASELEKSRPGQPASGAHSSRMGGRFLILRDSSVVRTLDLSLGANNRTSARCYLLLRIAIGLDDGTRPGSTNRRGPIHKISNLRMCVVDDRGNVWAPASVSASTYRTNADTYNTYAAERVLPARWPYNGARTNGPY